ncbi:hypothetical protein Pint_23704 [Pistacia integerrima]|uniref:Uncharacterized protein n=1 Tax=Pistacia integerrima TaxID=434235 RepID=A0ACC0YGL4_9ROSI|nr:hypothetical protein Pint_23704 [Pistacia integerrima]
MCNLRNLDLSHNDINGDIEEFIEALSGCNNSTLRWFDSSSNKLGGRLPDSIGSFEYLYWLDLSNNSFLGPLPTSIGNLSRLGKLDLSFNKMSGAIPENIGQLSVVHQLNLYGNSWEGVITENHLQNLTRLRDFSLSSKGNALVFNVEANWIAPFSLFSLALSGCQLPAFPSWLITQVRLSELTISSASISDNIPDWFWRLLPNIWWLDLSHNKLRGELPHTISAFPALHAYNIVLDG